MFCQQCEKPVPTIRGHRMRLYCSDACRQAACRKKKSQSEKVQEEVNYGEYNQLTLRCLSDIRRRFGDEAGDLAERAVRYSHL